MKAAKDKVRSGKRLTLIQDIFPSSYMPGVGRQVMKRGGSIEPKKSVLSSQNKLTPSKLKKRGHGGRPA